MVESSFLRMPIIQASPRRIKLGLFFLSVSENCFQKVCVGPITWSSLKPSNPRLCHFFAAFWIWCCVSALFKLSFGSSLILRNR